MVHWPDGQFDPTAGITLDLGDGVQVGGMRLDTSRQILRALVRVDQGARTGPRLVRIQQHGETILQLHNQVFVADDLPTSGRCADVLLEPAVADGTWLGSLDNLPPLLTTGDCTFGELHGGAQAVPVNLLAGQRVEAELIDRNFLGLLYVLHTCDPMGPGTCVRPITYQQATELEYTALVDEQVLLVVASPDPEPGQQFALNIERSDAEPWVMVAPDRIGVLTNQRFTVRSTRGPVAADPQLEIGGVAAQEVLVSDDGLQISGVITLPDGQPSAEPITGSLADGQRLTAPAAARTRVFSVGLECGTGLNHGAGSWTGETSFGDLSNDGPAVCDAPAFGIAQTLRIDLEPGQTLQASAKLLDADAVLYLLRDCDDLQGLTCSDVGSDSDWEYVRYTAPNEPTTVYLVVDSAENLNGDSFLLELDLDF